MIIFYLSPSHLCILVVISVLPLWRIKTNKNQLIYITFKEQRVAEIDILLPVLDDLISHVINNGELDS